MIRLQSFSHLLSRYERPNERWVCGWAASGQPCRIGPDSRGHCQATAECQPARKGDRWECTRPPSAGGRCTEGPLADGGCSHPIPPCVPVRSQRSRRGQFVGLSLAALLGLLAILLSGDRAAWLIEPGRVAAQHAGVPQCTGCHTSFAAGPVGWLHAAFVDAPPSATAQPCLACHDIGGHPMSAHGLDAATLLRLRRSLAPPAHAAAPAGSANAASLTPAALTLPAKARGDIACSTCHREHRGVDAKLTAVSDGTCQTCHIQQFGSLANGHPDFGNYPFRRRTRIIFDHAAHFDQHFAKSDKALVPADCGGCHAISAAGDTMAVKPFETACAGCHLDQIRGKEAAGDKGIAVLGVPGLDLRRLRAHAAAIGGWPEQADADMSPFLRFLLASRPDTAKDLNTLGALSLGDLSQASPEQIAAAERIAWAIKELLFDLGVKGPAVIARAAAGEDAKTLDALSGTVGGLPPDAVRAAEKDWFPDLADEVSAHRAGKPVPMKGGDAPPAASSSAAPQQPEPPAEANAPAAAPGGQGSILGSDNGSILGNAPAEAPPGGAPEPAQAAAPNAPAAAPDGQGSILGSDNGSILGNAPAEAAGSPPQGDSNGSILGGGILGGAPATPAEPEAASAPPAPEQPEAPKPVDGETWTALGGGWYRLDYALYYRPTGHADPFLQAWLDVLGRAARDAKTPAGQLFARLSDPTAPGVCAKCHSIDRTAEGVRRVNWFPFRPDREQHGFTKFAHLPHLSLFGKDACKTCHQVAASGDFEASYKGGDPHKLAASFKPIKRELCADCHVAGRVSDSCVTCHDYHIGRIPPARGVSTMNSRPGPPPATEESAAPLGSLRRSEAARDTRVTGRTSSD